MMILSCHDYWSGTMILDTGHRVSPGTCFAITEPAVVLFKSRPLTLGGPRARAGRPVGPARGPVWPVGPWARRGP